MDYTEEDFLRDARKRGPGRYTATQTKARQLAEERQKKRRADAMIRASKSTQSFEDYISGKGSQ